MKTSYPKEKLHILLLENISAQAVNQFETNGYTQITQLSKALSEEELIQQIKNVHVLGIRSKTNITDKVLEAAEKLLAIGAFCIGTDQVNLKAATDNGIVVFNAPFSNTRSVAELTIGAIIMLMRRIPDKNMAAHKGIWMKEAKDCHELRGKTLGIIGYGNIGSQVSILAEAMGLNVIYYDVEKKLPLGNARAMADPKSVLEQADIITLHTPSVPSMQQFINKERISWCKKGAILINYSRGEVVDADAVKDALEDGSLAGVAIDVYPKEPEKNGAEFSSPLQNLSNVLLTPHIGGSTEEAQVNIGTDVSSKIIYYIETGNTQGSLTVPELSLPIQENAHRILHIHKNVPGVLSEINTQLASNGINILGQYLKTNETIGYVVLDVDHTLSASALELLKKVKGTVKVRILY
jgi:D-3-phosphoglycerate dehydrogenase / 2-oxoglutarate reductase